MLRSNNSIPPITTIWIQVPLLSSLIFLQVLNWISALRNLGARYFPRFLSSITNLMSFFALNEFDIKGIQKLKKKRVEFTAPVNSGKPFS